MRFGIHLILHYFWIPNVSHPHLVLLLQGWVPATDVCKHVHKLRFCQFWGWDFVFPAVFHHKDQIWKCMDNFDGKNCWTHIRFGYSCQDLVIRIVLLIALLQDPNFYKLFHSWKGSNAIAKRLPLPLCPQWTGQDAAAKPPCVQSVLQILSCETCCQINRTRQFIQW